MQNPPEPLLQHKGLVKVLAITKKRKSILHSRPEKNSYPARVSRLFPMNYSPSIIFVSISAMDSALYVWVHRQGLEAVKKV